MSSFLNKKEIIDFVNGIEGWLNPPVVELLYQLSSRLPVNAVICEIGAWKGKSTCLLALASKDFVSIHSIDPHTGSHEHKHLYGDDISSYEDFLRNLELAGVSSKVKAYRLSSIQAFQEVPEGIDFLWIDGSHDYKDVHFDLFQYFQKLNVGAVVAMHDYKWQGVKEVVWELLNSNLKISKVIRIEDTHYFYKTSKIHISDLIYNRLLLKYYKGLQYLKRRQRSKRKSKQKKLLKKN